MEFLLFKEIIASRNKSLPRTINIFAGNNANGFPFFLNENHILSCFFPILAILQCFSTFTKSNFLFQVFLHLAMHRFVEIVLVTEKEVTGSAVTIVYFNVPFFGHITDLTPLFLNIKHLLDFIVPIPNRI
ncbi:hypothetical protein SDC9_177570 [bioreactor metagenome]|uniref:Uncharacterized protein n=1 Tax=bioreactor metagenome TaxID=1076179 RepID=A0A645GVQ5_9ZZZZ